MFAIGNLTESGLVAISWAPTQSRVFSALYVASELKRCIECPLVFVQDAPTRSNIELRLLNDT